MSLKKIKNIIKSKISEKDVQINNINMKSIGIAILYGGIIAGSVFAAGLIAPASFFGAIGLLGVATVGGFSISKVLQNRTNQVERLKKEKNKLNELISSEGELKIKNTQKSRDDREKERDTLNEEFDELNEKYNRSRIFSLGSKIGTAAMAGLAIATGGAFPALIGLGLVGFSKHFDKVEIANRTKRDEVLEKIESISDVIDISSSMPIDDDNNTNDNTVNNGTSNTESKERTQSLTPPPIKTNINNEENFAETMLNMEIKSKFDALNEDYNNSLISKTEYQKKLREIRLDYMSELRKLRELDSTKSKER